MVILRATLESRHGIAASRGQAEITVFNVIQTYDNGGLHDRPSRQQQQPVGGKSRQEQYWFTTAILYLSRSAELTIDGNSALGAYM